MVPTTRTALGVSSLKEFRIRLEVMALSVQLSFVEICGVGVVVIFWKLELAAPVIEVHLFKLFPELASRESVSCRNDPLAVGIKVKRGETTFRV